MRQTGTCTWLFGNETFKKWRSQGSGPLWLYGIRKCGRNIIRTFANSFFGSAGSGKTILA